MDERVVALADNITDICLLISAILSYAIAMTRAKPASDADRRTSSAPPVGVHILDAAARLIAAGGRDAATTRAIAAAAKVQAPVIYRLFTDKRGLLSAVAEHELSKYVAAKAERAPDPDPVTDLRNGWDMHVAFGLAHPDLFAIISGLAEEQMTPAAVSKGREVLCARVHRIALAGRLTVSEERAIALLESVCTGTVLHLLGQPASERDAGLSHAARDATIAAITSASAGAPVAGPAAAAAMLRASLASTNVLSDGEALLLTELLDRIANARQST